MYPTRVPLDARVGLGGKQRVCQRCEQPGHAIYECKNPRPYKSRPTRTQVLANPALEEKIRPKEAHVEEVRRAGVAAEVLAEREREREHERGHGRDRERGRDREHERGRPERPSPLSDSGSDRDDSGDDDSLSHPTSCSTCSPRSLASSRHASPDDRDTSPSARAPADDLDDKPLSPIRRTQNLTYAQGRRRSASPPESPRPDERLLRSRP